MPIGSVAKTVSEHWKGGIVSGLLVVDAVALSLCLLDSARFSSKGLSLKSALSVLQEPPVGKSVWLGLAVLVFFVLALPMAVALLSALLSPREHWPTYLGIRARGMLLSHLLLSGGISLFTVTAVTMQTLSGWTKDGEVWRYSFLSFWLSLVLLGQPAYVFYLSPIIRKFLVRAVAKPKAANVREIANDVTKEVLTEEGMDRAG
jgi:hypothetical protein